MGLKIGLVVVVPVLLDGSNPALQDTERNRLVSNHRKRLSRPRKTSRKKIRKDLQRYAARWPDRRFWLGGDILVEPQSGNRVRLTFPLRYDLRNGGKHSSSKVNKAVVLEPAGDDFLIVAENERKAG